MNFVAFQLDHRIESGIEALGYTEPTSIQSQSIPSILQGRDLMGMAQTGTGKTAAFALPILQHLLSGPRNVVRALIIAPTRELAEQTREAFGQLGRYTKLRSISVYGGVDKNPQIKKLRDGAEIVVACPGRLLDLMDQRVIDLTHVEILVLDESDRMFDMGFLPDVRKILKRIPAKRQTLLFSATMPEDIRSLAKETLRDPVIVQVGESVPVLHGLSCCLPGRGAPQNSPAHEDPGAHRLGIRADLYPHKRPSHTSRLADEKGRVPCGGTPGGPVAETTPESAQGIS